MKSKLMALLLVFSALFIAVAFYGAQENMAEWDQFEKDFQQKSFKVSQDTSFHDISSNSKTTKKSKKSKNRPGDKSENKLAKKILKAPKSKAYQPTEQDPLQHIPQEIQELESFQQLVDFRNDELDLVLESENKAELADVARQVIQKIGHCLVNQKCLEKKVQEDPNYDLKNTRSYQLLERALHAGIILSEENPRYADNFDQEMAQKVFEIQDSDIQSLGVEILTVADDLSHDSFNQLLEKAPQLESESRAVLFSQTERFTRGQDKKRTRYLNELKNELKRDAESAVEILKYLQFVKLSQQELVQVSRGLCQLKSKKDSKSWKNIEYHHGLYQSAKGNQISLDKICQN